MKLFGLRKEGIEFPVDVALTLLDTGDGLHACEERFRNVFDSMLEGFQIIGFDWKYLYLNDTVARQGHRTIEEFVGHTVMELYPGIEETAMFMTLRNCWRNA